jgi:LPXTG-motif cell wall-anchored protein/uncharacterized repeat protein (TIGR01451 family)
MTGKTKNLISVLAAVILVAAANKPVFADHCESTYGGGETCVYNKRFQIDKDVRIEGDSEWQEDKVTGVKKGEIVEFRIKIKNLSDEGAGSFDNMKMEDFLPKELLFQDTEGLSETWNDFHYKDTKIFYLKVKIDSKEFDRTDNFEKCVVNKAEVRWDGKYENSDTATVCYGNGTPSELPETGSTSDLAIIGFGLLFVGLIAKVTRKLISR